MSRDELLQALRRMAPETGSLACLGCGHEHGCSTRGCAIIRAAVDEIEELARHNEQEEIHRTLDLLQKPCRESVPLVSTAQGVDPRGPDQRPR